MAIYLVNTSTGVGPRKPGGPYYFGLRSTNTVLLNSIDAFVGSSDVQHHGLLPEADPQLESYGAVATFRPLYGWGPPTDGVARSTSGGNLVITRSGQDQYARSVYGITSPAPAGSSLLGYVRFRKQSWTTFANPDWVNLPSMAGVYMGFYPNEHRVGLDVFLQAGATPGLVYGSPLLAIGAPRTYQQTALFDWVSLANGTPIELWFVLNNEGVFFPYDPPNVPVMEIWAAAGATIPLTRVDRIPLGRLGLTPNTRISYDAQLFLGITGESGNDSLVIEDWGIYSDFRMAVDQGFAHLGHSMSVSPSSPLSFRAADHLAPSESVNLWRSSFAPAAVVTTRFGYQPGQRSTSQYYKLSKAGAGIASLDRDEPLLSLGTAGMSIEALMSCVPKTYDQGVFGAGLEIADGSHAYRLVTVLTPTGPQLALMQSGSVFAPSTYLPLGGGDPTTLRLVRLTLDKLRNEIHVDADGERLWEAPIPVAMQTTAMCGFRMGHLLDLDSAGDFNLSSVNAYSSYYAFEAKDGSLPDASAVTPFPFEASVDGSASITDSLLKVGKTAYNAPGTYAFFWKPFPFQDAHGAWAEFEMKIPYYLSQDGVPLSPNIETGVGLTMYFGENMVRVGFFDCGMNGRFVGIVPGSGSVQDIINQTALGRRYSCRCDWTDWNTFRLHYRPYGQIELWVGSTAVAPNIVIPWGTDVDVPHTPSPMFGLAFGHYSALTASRSEWRLVRWGDSPGYDLKIEQQFQGDPSPSQFGGKNSYLLAFSSEEGGIGELDFPLDEELPP